MKEVEIGDALQAYQSLAVLDADGLIDPVCTRHDDGQEFFLQKQVVKRRVGQHDALVGYTRRHRGRDNLVLALAAQYDGPPG